MRKLTIAEMDQVSGGNRYGDSTEDYAWQEMGSGDYEWYVGNFLADVQSAIDREVAKAGATTEQQAHQIAQNYLNSVGLSGYVSASPATLDGDVVVVTGDRYDRPSFGFGSFDPFLAMSTSLSVGLAYDLAETVLDAGNVTIELDPNLGPLTPQQQAAIDTLRTSYGQWLERLHTIPATTVFQIPGLGNISVNELVSSLSLADFKIMPSNASWGNAPVGVDPASYAGGGTYWNNGNPIFEVKIDQLVNYMSSQTMIAWYFTHELAHATALGYSYTLSMRAAGSLLGSQLHPDEGQLLEKFADALGRTIGTAAGFNWEQFNGFYPGGPTVTTSTSSGGTGSTGSTGGTGAGTSGGGGGWKNVNLV